MNNTTTEMDNKGTEMKETIDWEKDDLYTKLVKQPVEDKPKKESFCTKGEDIFILMIFVIMFIFLL